MVSLFPCRESQWSFRPHWVFSQSCTILWELQTYYYSKTGHNLLYKGKVWFYKMQPSGRLKEIRSKCQTLGDAYLTDIVEDNIEPWVISAEAVLSFRGNLESVSQQKRSVSHTYTENQKLNWMMLVATFKNSFSSHRSQTHFHIMLNNVDQFI